jgi:5-methyltetrahydropteroyltriglutamate--homocysteine methyltransferase
VSDRVPQSTVHGFPRIGARRELKSAVESYWAGRSSNDQLGSAAAELRATNWGVMADAGIELIPCNDFSLYDHVLDATVLVGAIPGRYRQEHLSPLDRYFAMARGRAADQDGPELAPLPMTKWFNTNYHYIVPELGPQTSFSLADTKPFDEFIEATSLGHRAKPVLLGPLTFLLLAQDTDGNAVDTSALLDDLIDVYAEVLTRFGSLGAEWVQFDEPAFVVDRADAELALLERAYDRLSAVTDRPRVLVTTYFGEPGQAFDRLLRTGVEGIGLDLVAGHETLERTREMEALADRVLFAGVVDGRNVWANDLDRSRRQLDRARQLAGNVVVSTSCSLLHVPITLQQETALDPELRSWLAFAEEKLAEVVVLAAGLRDGWDTVTEQFAVWHRILESRADSQRTYDPETRRKMDDLANLAERRPPHDQRRRAQQARFHLPILPTTTIGSFPQTPELRASRAAFLAGRITVDDYDDTIGQAIASVIALQESLGLDVLVHGEPERNDMVAYFAEQLDGFAITHHGWVQSYGSRCVRPPILYGDVQRSGPITIRWARLAQGLTGHPVKGMLTGPVTMLQWSFPREDQPRRLTAMQIALALRDEIADLEAAGIGMIQVDEPAIREGLPLRRGERGEYATWAAEAFRVATSGVRDETQIHTHMCYSQFADILAIIEDLDADVVSIEASRSRMRLLGDLDRLGTVPGLGPGVYDIHSSRVPSTDEIHALLQRAAEHLSLDQLWVNPDCGLKTRGYDEIIPALAHLVAATRLFRSEHASSGAASTLFDARDADHTRHDERVHQQGRDQFS